MSKPKRIRQALIERYELSGDPADEAIVIFLQSGLDEETFGLYMDHAREIVQERMKVVATRLPAEDYLLSVNNRMEYVVALLRHFVYGPDRLKSGA